jgi:hypothetical protein
MDKRSGKKEKQKKKPVAISTDKLPLIPVKPPKK